MYPVPCTQYLSPVPYTCTCTSPQYLDEVRTVAKAFIQLGLRAGHGVGIIGFNSPEWFFAGRPV